MARMLEQFNAKDNEKMGDFTPIDAGTYPAHIVASDMKETKDGEGHYLQLRFQILGGEFNGRVVFDRLNLQNKNVQTVEIAKKALATICEVCGIDLLNDSEQLHNIPMNIKVVIKPAKAQYAEQNEIKGYEPHDGKVPEGGGAGFPKAATLPGQQETRKTTGTTLPAEETETSGKETATKVPPWKKN